MVEKLFNSIKGLALVIIALFFISCGYNYIGYVNQIEQANSEISKVHDRYNNIRWEIIESGIHVLNHDAEIHSKYTALNLRNRISEDYSDLEVLKYEFSNGQYSNTKFGNIVMDLVEGSIIVQMHPNIRSGVMIACDDVLLYNLINLDGFNLNWNKFIQYNHNAELAKDVYNKINLRSTDIKIIEPKRHTLDSHKYITNSNINEIKQVYFSEGLSGLSGYILLNPTYITNTGDIFGQSDYDNDGNKRKNYKLVVISYLSIYDSIVTEHAATIRGLDRFEDNEISSINNKIIDIYYDSIRSLLFHIVCIITLMTLCRSYIKK